MRKAVMVGAAAFALSSCHLIPGTDAATKQEAMDAIAETLVDPSSARFRNVEVKQIPSGDETVVVCGEVNGKNRMGGYSGFTRFAYEISSGTGLFDPQSSITDGDVIEAEKTCRVLEQATCSRADRLTEEMANQAGFDGAWREFCEDADSTQR